MAGLLCRTFNHSLLSEDKYEMYVISKEATIYSPGLGVRVLNPAELSSGGNLQNKTHDFTG